MNDGSDADVALAPALEHARAYVRSRQSEDGMFCFYRSAYVDEPNLFDTWHAISALKLLNGPVPRRERAAEVIASMPIEPQPHALYYRVRSLLALQAPDSSEPAVIEATAALVPRIPTPGELSGAGADSHALVHIGWLKRHFGLAWTAQEIAEALLRLEAPSGGFPDLPNLLATRAVWSILQLCGRSPSTASGEFVRSLSLPQFGFTLTATSLAPSLEITCAGVWCCRASAQELPHRDDTLSFILACQGGRGGFARAPGALPDLAMTHLAVEGIRLLTARSRAGLRRHAEGE